MAEVFGVVTGAAGLISLAVQINKGIETLRDARQRADGAPAELETLTRELEFLAIVMDQVIRKAPPSDSFIIQHCERSCDQVVKRLHSLRKMLLESSKAEGPKKIIKILAFRRWKENVDSLIGCIRDAKTNLGLVSTLQIPSLIIEELELVTRLQQPRVDQTTRNGNRSAELQIGPMSSSALADSPLGYDMKVARSGDTTRSPRRQDCLRSACSCSCHRTEEVQGRFWALKYTPVAAFQNTCDNPQCSGSKHGVKLRLALSRYGLRWAAIVQFQIQTTAGRVSLHPALEIERIVPYTSRGFQLIRMFHQDLMSTEEIMHELTVLAQKDPTFRHHVNPAGVNYLEAFLISPTSLSWYYARQDKDFKFIQFLSSELGLIEKTCPARLVECCAIESKRWESWDVGPTQLLNHLVEQGLETTEVEIINPSMWSKGFRARGSDFCLGLLDEICSNNQGFAGMTPLHEAVLSGTAESVEYWIARSEKNSRNSLGQTPMHLSVRRPVQLACLIRYGHDINATDLSGITPLAYAAGLGQLEAMSMIIETGADLYFTDLKAHVWDPEARQNFLTFACESEQWDIVLGGLRILKNSVDREMIQIIGQEVTKDYMSKHRYMKFDTNLLGNLLTEWRPENLDISSNLGLKQACSLFLGLATSADMLEPFIDHGFPIVGHTNQLGQNELTTILNVDYLKSADLYPGLANRLIDLGVLVNQEDDLHRTPLHYWFRNGAVSPDHLKNGIMAAGVLISRGADTAHTDRCRCSCAPNGCLPAGGLEATGSIPDTDENFRLPLFSIECLHIAEELGVPGPPRKMLLSFIRRAKHEELGMTHVCCSRRREYDDLGRRTHCDPMDDNDINEILEEEAEFIDILEQEMGEISEKGYEELMAYWFSQIYKALGRCAGGCILPNDWETRTHSLDHENDRYVEREPVRISSAQKVHHDLVAYISELEKIYQSDDAYNCSVSMWAETKDKWYTTRRDRLLQLLAALEIGPDEFV